MQYVGFDCMCYVFVGIVVGFKLCYCFYCIDGIVYCYVGVGVLQYGQVVFLVIDGYYVGVVDVQVFGQFLQVWVFVGVVVEYFQEEWCIFQYCEMFGQCVGQVCDGGIQYVRCVDYYQFDEGY